jgi:hypothetical protein
MYAFTLAILKFYLVLNGQDVMSTGFLIQCLLTKCGGGCLLIKAVRFQNLLPTYVLPQNQLIFISPKFTNGPIIKLQPGRAPPCSIIRKERNCEALPTLPCFLTRVTG